MDRNEALRNLCIAFGLLGFIYYLSTFYNEDNSSEVVSLLLNVFIFMFVFLKG